MKYLYYAIMLLLIILISTSIFTINYDEQGIVTRCGKFYKKVLPGLNYKMPFPIDKIEKISVTRIKKDIIGRNLRIIKNIDNDLNFSKESQMLTRDENIIDMHFYVHWKVINPEDYIFNIKHTNKDDIVKNVAESIMRQIVGIVNISEALSERRYILEYTLRRGLQKILKYYKTGIEIVNVGILYSYVAPEVRDSYRDVQSAKADKEKYINQAHAYKNQIIPKAKGNARSILERALAYNNSVVANAIGDTNKFYEIYKSYLQFKDITRMKMYLETLEDFYKNVNKIIIDGNVIKNNEVFPVININ